jgi:heptosyltransferase-2
LQILIIGASWVGDMVMAQSLLKVLKQQHPSAQIDVLAPEWSRPILTRMPEVRGTHAMPVGHGKLDLKSRKQVAKALKSIGYDQTIVLPNSLKSALIPWLAKIPQRTGWRGEMRYGLLNDIRPLDKSKYPLMIDRFCALAYSKDAPLPEKLPYPELEIEPENQQAALDKLGLHLNNPMIALCPGAEFGESKRWPEHHYAAVAQQLISQGHQVWIFGSEKDQLVGDAIVNGLPESAKGMITNLAGKTSLADAVDLLAYSKAVITNDSGLMHVAAALKRPLIAIYGSTSPDFTPPLSDNVKIARLDLDCSPCFERTCPLGHGHCLTQLMPDRILNAFIELSL